MSSESKKYAALSSIPEKRIRELEELLAASVVRIRQLEDQLRSRRQTAVETFYEHSADMEDVQAKINDMRSEGESPRAATHLAAREKLCGIYQRMAHAARNESQYLLIRCELLELEAESN